jgi:hypothetical protein
VKQFYRSKNRIVYADADMPTETFDSINQAKRKSRELQKAGWKFVPKGAK